MTTCEVCGRQIGYCVDASTRRRIVLDVEQKVYTPQRISDMSEVDNGFSAVRTTLAAAVHLCKGKP